MPHLPTLILVLWACGIACFDALYRRIPNMLSLGGWILAMSLLLFRQTSLTGVLLWSVLLAGGFGLLVTLPAYAFKRLGAGDVKFLVGIGLLTSFGITVNCFLIAAMAGGAMALFWLSLPTLWMWLPDRLTPPGSKLARWVATPVRDRRMAYGTCLAAGLMASLWIERSGA